MTTLAFLAGTTTGALIMAFVQAARKLTPSATEFHSDCIARGLPPDHEARRWGAR